MNLSMRSIACIIAGKAKKVHGLLGRTALNINIRLLFHQQSVCIFTCCETLYFSMCCCVVAGGWLIFSNHFRFSIAEKPLFVNSFF